MDFVVADGDESTLVAGNGDWGLMPSLVVDVVISSVLSHPMDSTEVFSKVIRCTLLRALVMNEL